jgi:CheY-like chemotaxis protein
MELGQAAFHAVLASKQVLMARTPLPMHSEQTTIHAPRDLQSTLPESMPSTLLLIDDNAIQAATRQTILKRAGYFVIAVLSPERALEQFRSNDYPAPIDLVITDHLMPGMNGCEFVRKLRTFAPDIPVLVISGMAEAEEEYEDLDVSFRLKPVLPDYLIESVHHLVESRSSARI